MNFMNSSDTNRQAQNVLQSDNVTPRSRANSWKALQVEEFQIWLALLYHMGHVQMNNLQHYWKTDQLFKNEIFSQFMSRDRFLGILQALHLSEYTTENVRTSGDRMYRIRPLIDWFNARMSTIYYPDRVLIVDEPIMLHRGRLVFRQYGENVGHKSNVKLCVLHDTKGVALRMVIHAGDVAGGGHRSKVVKQLLRDFLNHGHSIFMSPYYNSVQLTHELLLLKTYSTGTLRPNYKMDIPSDVLKKSLKSGEIVSRYNGSICVANWKHKRDVLFVSSQFEDDLVGIPTGKSITFKPRALVEYHNHLEGVDHDQLFAYYSCEKLTLKWFKKIGIHIFQIILSNSYLLYKSNCPSGLNTTFFDFRMEVIKSLLEPLINRKRRRSEVLASYGSHFPDLSTLPENSSRRIQKRCRNCQKKGIRKQVTFICPDCPDEPGLCLRPCFQEYHKIL